MSYRAAADKAVGVQNCNSSSFFLIRPRAVDRGTPDRTFRRVTIAILRKHKSDVNQNPHVCTRPGAGWTAQSTVPNKKHQTLAAPRCFYRSSAEPPFPRFQQQRHVKKLSTTKRFRLSYKYRTCTPIGSVSRSRTCGSPPNPPPTGPAVCRVFRPWCFCFVIGRGLREAGTTSHPRRRRQSSRVEHTAPAAPS